METKICTKCSQEKPLEEFRMVKGRKGKRYRQGTCFACMQAYKKAHYDKDREKYLARSKAFREANHDTYIAYLREYTKTHKEENKLRYKAYAESGKARVVNKLSARRYRATNQGHWKDRVRSLVAYALKIGIMTKPDRCDMCRQSCVPEAHHADYSKPLEVAWLCKSCHEEIHHHLNEGDASSE